MLLRGQVVLTAPHGLIPDGVVVTKGEQIAWVGPASQLPAQYSTEDSEGTSIPASDKFILPGLIDAHCHGGGGYGFAESDLEGIQKVSEYHRSQGTTTLLGSLVSASIEKLMQQVELLAQAVDLNYIKGIHLEGPFISPQRKGAQDPKYITEGDPQGLEKILTMAAGKVKSMTIAPEVKNFSECVNILNDQKVVVSLGHTIANMQQAEEYIASLPKNSSTTVTHLFNGMNPLHHRNPGMVAAAIKGAAESKLTLELISDGIHLAAGTVNFIYTIVPGKQIMLVSDAMEAAGMPDGAYRLGSLETVVSGGVARLKTLDGEPGAIAGGTSTILQEVKQAVQNSRIDLSTAVASGSTVPAKVFGWNDRGSIQIGKRADLVVVDKEFEVDTVIYGGKKWR